MKVNKTKISQKRVDAWQTTYEIVVGNIGGYRTKLSKLLTKERPNVDKQRDFLGEWTEWNNKVKALRELIINNVKNIHGSNRKFN